VAPNRNRSGWPVRDCPVCNKTFRKAPTYATCGHPICVKENRNGKKKVARERREGLPTWEPPNNMAPDEKVRAQVRRNLDRIRIDELPDRVVSRAIQIVAMKSGVTIAEAYEIWKSTRKEYQSA